MITPGMFGGMSALCLGTADFMGRFSSRALDHYNALLGMLTAGFIVMTVWIWLVSGLPSFQSLSLGWISINGIATTVMTLLLYLGLSRGPVSVVAPIVSAHPVLVILFYVFWQGATLSSIQMIAMVATITGAIIVARSANDEAEAIAGPVNAGPDASTFLVITVFIALGSSLAYAVLIIAGQAAAEIHGQVHTLWMGRLVSIFFLLLLFMVRRRAPSIPVRWWPFLCAQGILDAGGYIALFAGSHGVGKGIVAVVASTFGVVTVLLARFILKENISTVQWLGILLIFTGVIVLSL